MMNNLDKYRLVYSITALPNILFASTTTANEPLSFNSASFTIPIEIKDNPLEVRIYLFNPEGSLIEMTSNILPHSPNIVCQTAELSGLKLVKQLIDRLNSSQVNQ